MNGYTTKASKLRGNVLAAGDRKCLKCGRAFSPTSRWNKLCHICNAANDRRGMR